MKKYLILIVALIASICMVITAEAARLTYSEWYKKKFGMWPDGTVLEWEKDPVYWEYLIENDPAEYSRLVKKQGEKKNEVRITSAEWKGRTARWESQGNITKYEVRLFFEDDTQIAKVTTEGKHYDFSEYMYYDGTYWFDVRPYARSGKWMDRYEAEGNYFESYFEHRGTPGGPNSGGGWVDTGSGWQYYENGAPVRNDWRKVNNYWYWFNADGTMLTGWQWINGKCYYLTPVQGLGGYPQGACWINTVTPDGFTVDSTGAWTVNGYVQLR